ncbi:hypothetical protein MIAR_21100 [Microbacterium arabinogalactanolyticum]|nr:hypothetical protein MIAR_21100 [Microbacterium arabinogalactanolyticum]
MLVVVAVRVTVGMIMIMIMTVVVRFVGVVMLVVHVLRGHSPARSWWW